MKVNKIIVITFLIMSASLIDLIESKKLLLGLVGLHAMRHMHHMHHLHIIPYLLPIKYATDAWRAYGEATGGHHHKGHGHEEYKHRLPKIKLSHEEGERLDKWISHYYPDDDMELDSYY